MLNTVKGAFLLVPESPRWLALRNRPDEAASALASIQGLTMAEAESQVREMTKMTMNNAKAAAGTNDAPVEEASVVQKLQDIVASSTNRRALTIGVGLVLFQQLSGQPSVLYFANRIFESAGLGFEAAVGVGVFKFVMTIVSAALVEDPKWGRRSLLLYGNAGVTVSLACLTTLYATAGDGVPNQAAVIACILAFVGSYQIGFGPITWLVLSEVFPLQVRSAAIRYVHTRYSLTLRPYYKSTLTSYPVNTSFQSLRPLHPNLLTHFLNSSTPPSPPPSLPFTTLFDPTSNPTLISIGTLANFGSNLLVALLFELERVNLGEAALFGQFAVIALAATLFTNKYVFETRGLSLEEIETKLQSIVDDEDAASAKV